MQTPFIGPSYNLDSRPASVQRTINMVPVPLEPGNERAPWVFKDVPGLVDFLVDEPDPFFGDVIFLLNGEGLTTDSSSYARALTAVGSIALDATKTLNSFNTYYKPSGANRLTTTASDSWVATLLGANEFCWELNVNKNTYSAAFPPDEQIMYLGPFQIKLSDNDSLQWAALNIAATSYSTTTAAGAVPANVWRHVCLIRDNTTDPINGYMRLAIDGTVVGSSLPFLKAGAAIGVGLDTVIGWGSLGWPGAIGGMRITNNTRRYLTNAEGGTPNTFTPDLYPFAVG